MLVTGRKMGRSEVRNKRLQLNRNNGSAKNRQSSSLDEIATNISKNRVNWKNFERNTVQEIESELKGELVNSKKSGVIVALKRAT